MAAVSESMPSSVGGISDDQAVQATNDDATSCKRLGIMFLAYNLSVKILQICSDERILAR